MRILAIDPGNVESAFVIYKDGVILEKGKLENKIIVENILLNNKYRNLLSAEKCDHLAIEMVACYGMAVGKTVFDTCVWIGRFIQAWNNNHTQIYRKDVKMFLCNSVKAKDGNIRQAIIDKFPPTGDGKIPQVGTKKKPGPLFGVHDDIWAALGVAMTFENNLIDTNSIGSYETGR
jgi:hypothetical protein